MSKMEKLTVRTWEITRLHGYGRQLRKNDAAVDSMVKSIEAYGFKIPLLVTAAGEVIDGHLRLKAAERLGRTELPVIVCQGWTPEQIRGFRLMANSSANWAEWDWEVVASELAELEALDFDLEWTGFDELALEDLLGERVPEDAIETAGHEAARCPICQRKLAAKRQGVR